MLKRLMITTALSVVLASPALAQSSNPQALDTPAQDQGANGSMGSPPLGASAPSLGTRGDVRLEQSESEIRASQILGMRVTNPLGQDLGSVEDIVLDTNGRITGVVVSTGGFLGIGAKPVGVAWNNLSSARTDDALVVELTKEQLAAAPDFKAMEEEVDSEAPNPKASPAAPRDPGSPPASGLDLQPPGSETQ